MPSRTVLSVLLVVCVMAAATSLAFAQAEGGAGEQAKGGGSVSYLDWFLVKGGPIAWLLILIDVASIALIISYFVGIRAQSIVPELARGQIGELIEAKQYKQIIEYTATEPSQLSYLIHQALAEAGHGYPAMERAMEEASEERTSKLLRKIEILNVIGNVGPMLGLLGTVYGMIKVFSKIVEERGMPEAWKLADGVGTALVTTFWGLIVAIPALAVYAVMRNRIDSLTSEAMMAAQESVSTFRPGVKKA